MPLTLVGLAPQPLLDKLALVRPRHPEHPDHLTHKTATLEHSQVEELRQGLLKLHAEAQVEAVVQVGHFRSEHFALSDDLAPCLFLRSAHPEKGGNVQDVENELVLVERTVGALVP